MLLGTQETEERKKVMKDPNSVVPAAFVSFRSRWGAAVCAQTQQTSNPTVWLTEWAPEPICFPHSQEVDNCCGILLP
jgi:hypothetical protein